MIKNQAKELCSYIYSDLQYKDLKRHEMIRYSTWRIYAYNQMQTAISDFRGSQARNAGYWKIGFFQKLTNTTEKSQFYNFLYKPSMDLKDSQTQARIDNISHFICRMLYCQEQNTKYKFISMEKRILENRLHARMNDFKNDKKLMMKMLKKMLSFFTNKNPQDYNIPQDQWNQFSEPIKSFVTRFYPTIQQFAKLPLEQGDIGLRRRRSYVHKGYVYISCDTMIDIIVSKYDSFLTEKLEKTKPIVNKLISEDVDNQFSVFLLQTIKQIYEQTMDEVKLNDNHKLTLRNIDYLSNKFFPPCMLNLNQHLKVNRHLRHDGRRQLWGFFKACGMDVHDNKQYFRRHVQGKVTAQDMKGHMYNIQHAYGLKGQRKDQQAWSCRGIISNAAPKKGQHHGCPFAHWRSEELGPFLRKNYNLTENRLDQIIGIKQEKHFQIACGRLFEYSEVNQYESAIPADITAKLGRSPNLFFEAAMQLRNLKEKKTNPNNSVIKEKQQSKAIDIQF